MQFVKVTTLPEDFPEAHSAVNNLRLEYVVAVEGVVRSRPSDAVNENMKTGFIEVYYRVLLGCIAMLNHMLELLGYEEKKIFLCFAFILVWPATLRSCLRDVAYFSSISTIQFSYVVTFRNMLMT